MKIKLKNNETGWKIVQKNCRYFVIMYSINVLSSIKLMWPFLPVSLSIQFYSYSNQTVIWSNDFMFAKVFFWICWMILLLPR